MKRLLAPALVIAALSLSSVTALGATLSRSGQDTGTLYDCTGRCHGQQVLCASPMIDCCIQLYEGENGWACVCRLPTQCP
mgnify:CR=1 FL=1